ncbi:MAG TPA: helix-turn-helix domain-containing protein [Polyangiaceae bacterium]|jgi:AcrR family transcriptional regulator
MVAALKKDRLRARLRVAVRDSILEAAERAIVEEGLEGANLLSIARRAGVAVGTIYNYFVDRQELFRELFTTRKAELVSALDAGMKRAAGQPFEGQLEAFARIFLESYDARRDFMRVVMGSEPLRLQMMCDRAGRLRSVIHELQLRAERVMRVGAREKRFRATEIPLLASVFTAILRGVVLALLDEKGTLVAAASRVVAIFCHGAT